MTFYFSDSLKNTCIKYWTAQWSSGIPTTSIKISDTGTTIFWLVYLKLVENNRFSNRSDWKKISHRLYIKPFLENPVRLSHFSFSTKGIETFCKILARIFWWAENPKLYLIDLEIKYWYKPTIPQPTAEQQDPTGKVENFEIPGKQIGAIARLNSSFSFNRITAIS